MKLMISMIVFLFGLSAYCAGEGSLGTSNAEFAFKLYGKLKDAKGNVLFSPYSISTAFAMTYAGARGETEKQMAEAMCFKLPQDELHPAFDELQKKINSYSSDKKCQLLVANSLWPDKNYKFLDGYLKTIKDNYGSETRPVDYQKESDKACVEINKWVEDKTEKKIKDLIPPGAIDPLTRLVLVNAIYFKVDHPFIFFIRDSVTGSILFMGRMQNP
ncbi:MAG: hypothetical protein A2X45_03210 [Lentisphaerae bacterium GWF2_50_93]|nr:MAG: hypothetical protein A2X45_03210 [Lentisphaerae bacterium GWF2_50_93]